MDLEDWVKFQKKEEVTAVNTERLANFINDNSRLVSMAGTTKRYTLAQIRFRKDGKLHLQLIGEPENRDYGLSIDIKPAEIIYID